MRISHPQAPYQGVAPENVFFVANDQHVQMGTGYVIPFMQKEMYPDRPLHLFVQIEAQPSARALLYGALLARAEQLKEQTPGLPVRLYSLVSPENLDMMHFYEACGFKDDDGEDMFRFTMPQGYPRVPMGMQFASVPLHDEASQVSFLNRLNAHRIQPFSRDHLTLWMQQQHFMALGFYKNGLPVAECIFTGTGQNVTLLMIYTAAEYRRQGMAIQLLESAFNLLRERGVITVYTHIFRRNLPQMKLVQHFGGHYLRTVSALPGIDL